MELRKIQKNKQKKNHNHMGTLHLRTPVPLINIKMNPLLAKRNPFNKETLTSLDTRPHCFHLPLSWLPPHTYTMHELLMDKDEPGQTNKAKAKDTVPWACGERWKSWSFPWWTPCGCPWRCDLWPRGAWGPPRPSCASWGPGSAACEPGPATSSWVSIQASTSSVCMGFYQSCVY